MATRPEPVLTALITPPAAALGIAFGVTVVLVTIFNYLVTPISQSLNLSSIEIASALSLHLATLIVALPLAGMLADRFGARTVVIVSALLFGGALALAANARSLAGLQFAFVAAGLAGAGASPVSYARVIVQRFTARRGLALGIALTGTGLGGIILPAIIQPVVADSGWRAALLLLAALVAAVGLLAGLLMGREGSRDAVSHADGMTLRQAFGTSAFWTIAVAFALLGVALSGVIAHLTEIFAALGVAVDRVPGFQATIGVATIIGRIAGGAAMDHMPARFVGAGAAVIGAVGMGLLASGPQGIGLLIVAVAIGLCTGTESDVVSYLASRLFGLRAFARIYAVQGSFFMIGFAAGPLAAAAGYARFGTPAMLVTASVLLAASAALLLSLRPPADKGPS